MNKFTPGPWKAREDDYQTDAINIGPNVGATVCRITGHAAVIKPAKANARLIAAAPDLLEELELAIQSLEHLNHGPHKGTERAKAVIKAATQ